MSLRESNFFNLKLLPHFPINKQRVHLARLPKIIYERAATVRIKRLATIYIQLDDAHESGPRALVAEF